MSVMVLHSLRCDKLTVSYDFTQTMYADWAVGLGHHNTDHTAVDLATFHSY